ncbi:hypothetical protein C1I93_22665 [Micromonospora endophytica]|uniref:Uncharacterized protein n=1 Tax=Micromonospora endophytica TaxID=515350 RepID=A0A2W2DCS2_9ACTN|nr:hypothetical protein C1I93_22665 [Micromonospora endophytica]RIW48323.1 DUF4012 domain-containing protein [Micromonospora endophytica]BCJ56661.1 hypothetical protein Jiend_00830 [Micromonospora endophytica]
MATSLLLSLTGWVGFRGWQARAHLVNAAGLAGELSAHLVSGDNERAERVLSALQGQSNAALRATGGFEWSLGRPVPYAGANLSAVRQIAIAIDDLARQAFPALVRVDLGVLTPREGRLDLAGLRTLGDELVKVDAAVRRIRTELAAVGDDRLITQVRAALETLRGELDRLAAMTSAAERAGRLLPPLLGADGPRRYLLVSQNSAELRATGGIFGAYAVIEADRGRVSLGDQGSGASVVALDDPLTVPTELRALWGELPGLYPADVNLSPHFPTAAALFREMYRRDRGETADGVLAVDPVVLSYLLTVTGPVRVPGGVTLTAENAVKTLLHDTYQRLEPAEQDSFFATAAATVFDVLFTRKVQSSGLLTAFDRSIQERRILFWSARPEEQRMFGDSRMAGVLPEQDTVPTVGVFLNDGSGAKLGYYLRQSADLTVGDCGTDRRRELKLRVTLRSTAPASGLSRSVTGLAMAGDPYTLRTLVSVYGPAGGVVRDARLDGTRTPMAAGTERHRQVATVNVEVGPGDSRTLEVSLLTGPTDSGAAELWLTPTATPWTTHVVTAPNCSQ